MPNYKILTIKSSPGYELLDSGEGEKLERFGEFTLSRPDPQALWPKLTDESEWKRADAYFTRDSAGAEWSFRNKINKDWQVDFGGLKMKIKPTAFKHTGLFPEQSANWDWLRDRVSDRPEAEVLNLFGYTGGATLACAQAGAKVVHIDGSKAAVSWARENAELSGLADKPIRWIVEDARTFVEREIRRGRQYDGIIMDPPAFGHGPESEVWKIEEHLMALLEGCKKLLKPKPAFFLLNGYSAGYSALAYENNLLPFVAQFGGKIEVGELAIEETGNKKGGDSPKRLLPCGIFARWSA